MLAHIYKGSKVKFAKKRGHEQSMGKTHKKLANGTHIAGTDTSHTKLDGGILKAKHTRGTYTNLKLSGRGNRSDAGKTQAAGLGREG